MDEVSILLKVPPIAHNDYNQTIISTVIFLNQQNHIFHLVHYVEFLK